MKQVFFSIPLASKMPSGQNWRLLEALLSRTLRSVLNQDDANFVALVCSHDRPDIPEMDEGRVVFLQSTVDRITEIKDGPADKGRKRKQMYTEIAKRGGGYVVMLDGDDLVSSRLVSYMRRVDSPYGYTFRTGFALDHESGACAPIPGAWSKPFTQVCGSSAAIFMNPEDAKSINGAPPYMHLFRQHSLWEQVAMEAGRPLVRVPFPPVMYRVNTPTSLHAQISEERANRVDEIAGLVREHRLHFDDTAKREFAL